MAQIITTFISLLLVVVASSSTTATTAPAFSVAPETAQTQQERFINVEGANLNARLSAAVQRARSASTRTRFWVAYSFDVRPGVAVDPNGGKFHGSMSTFDGIAVFFGTSGGAAAETRNLGLFLLYEPDGTTLARIDVYNLDRAREYSGYPVYWLGRGGNDESLKLLQGVVESGRAGLSERGVLGIALHDDPRVGGMLKTFVRTSSLHKDAREAAVFWLGHTGGEEQFLADLVRSDREDEDIREKAAHGLGMSKDPASTNLIISLYNSVQHREVREELIHAVSWSANQEMAIDFLIKTARTDADREVRKNAMFWLGQKAGDKTLGVLKDAVENTDDDTEVQKHAVFVISRRPADEAVPLLIKIARTHAKPEVRKDAIFWLGRTGDERALAFIEELLRK